MLGCVDEIHMKLLPHLFVCCCFFRMCLCFGISCQCRRQTQGMFKSHSFHYHLYVQNTVGMVNDLDAHYKSMSLISPFGRNMQIILAWTHEWMGMGTNFVRGWTTVASNIAICISCVTVVMLIIKRKCAVFARLS